MLQGIKAFTPHRVDVIILTRKPHALCRYGAGWGLVF